MNEQILYGRPLPGARLNFAHPLTKGLVGCWLLNEQGMRAMDLSPYGNHGTLTGFTDPPQRPFNGLLFDGAANYVAVPHHQHLGANLGFTAICWAKCTDVSASDRRMISKQKPGAPFDGWALSLIQTSGQLDGYLRDDATVTVEVIGDNGPNYADSQNHMFHMTISPTVTATGLGIGVDGRELKTGDISAIGSITTTVDLAIGKFRDASGYWIGNIYLVCIYTRALTARELQSSYMQPYDIFLKE